MTHLGLIASATIFAFSGVILANAATTPVSPGGGLQTAMDAASDGDTIQLSAGTYTTVAPNFFNINRAITLAGAPGGGTILQTATYNGLSINHSNVTVTNLTINAGPAILPVQNVSNITISGLTLNPNYATAGIGYFSGNAIAIGGSTNVSLSNVTLLDTAANTVNNGLDIENSTSVTVTGVTILSAPRGAYVLNGQSVTIQSSSIYATSFEGILTNGGTNLTIDTVTVPYAGADGIHLGTGSATNNAIVRNSTVTLAGSNGIIVEGSNSALVTGNTITRAMNQNGIWLKTAASSLVENNMIGRAGLAGINLDTSSTNNIVMGNSVLLTNTQNCVNIANSDLNTVVNNTLANCGTPGSAPGDGVLVLGGQQNRIERNTLTNYSNDGIVLTQSPNGAPPTDSSYRGSIGNYIAKNSITGYATSNPNPTIAQTSRTGIWMNDGSHGTYAFGNTESVANEGGITVFNANSNIIKGNVASANLQAGMYITSPDSPTFPKTTNTVIQNNYVFNNPANGEILVRGADFADIAFNYSSQNTPGSSAGINISSATGTGGAANHQVYRNIVGGAQFPTITDASTTVTAFFENRFFFPSGTGAFNQATAGGDIKYDADVYLGGNFWSTFSTSGNPSNGTPYSAFVNPVSGQPAGYVDRYPYSTEDLGMDHSVAVLAPTGSVVAAPGSMKTIAWRTKGCVLVDLTYTSSAGNGTIVSGYPDAGIYNWTVPANQGAASNFAIAVTCKNSAGTSLGTTGSSPAFTVPTTGLLLMTPGPDLMVNTGATLRVAWQRTPSVGNVDVYLQTSEGGALTLMSSNQSGDFVDITLPSTVTSRARVVIKATSNSAIQDSNDGYFSIRGTAPVFTNPPRGTPHIGDVVDLEWVSPAGSQFVDVDLINPGGQLAADLRASVDNIADRGRLTYLIPESWMVGGHIRLTFRDINGNVIGQLDDATPYNTSIAMTHVGNFTPGQNGAAYTVTVSNAGLTAASGTVTVTETVPSGMTLVSMAGAAWTCPGTAANNCTRSDSLAPGASYPAITVLVNVAINAASPLINAVGVSGGGSASASTIDSTFVVPNAPVLSIVKSHMGNFIQAQTGAVYTVTVSNATGASPTSGTVTVTEAVPFDMTLVSMSGTGWTCPGTAANNCMRGDSLNGGASYPAITVTVNVLANATSPETNQVSVAGGGSATANASDPTTIAVPTALRFVPITPCRIADTRNATGPFGGPIISGGSSRDFTIPSSACSIPSTAQAYSLNVAVVVPTGGTLGYLTLYPAGQSRPLASTLNSLDGRIKSNAAIVPAGTNGAVSVFASDATQVILDINGYFVPATDPTGLAFYPITPCRIADTRTATAPLGGPALVGGQYRTLPILASTCNLPATAQAYSLNFAAVPSGSLGYLTAWPAGQARPLAASLNALTGAITANAAIVPAGTGGSIDVFASDTPTW